MLDKLVVLGTVVRTRGTATGRLAYPPAPMGLRLYVVHGSHPCAAVEKAMSIKGLSYAVTEWPPPLHAPIQVALFGARTVPALKLDGEKVSGSRAIMRRLEQLAPTRLCSRPTRPPGRASRRRSAGATRSSSRSHAS